MNLLPEIFPEALVNALGWTLLHSLWQGALLAVILGLLLVVLHRHSAKIRYWVAGSALLFQLCFSGATFLYYGSQPEATVTASINPQLILQADAVAPSIEASTFWDAPLAATQVYFKEHLPLVVTCWALGLLLMLLRFIGGIAYTQRLRKYRTTALGQNWQNKLQLLSHHIGVKQTVKLMESAMVQVPVTIGFIKPVILMPIGAVTGLSQGQVEAVLAHELAHILRKDYLLNLVQSVVELLFFYHPAMWWISGVVRAEREHCCDDIAVAACGDTLTYARALAELEAMHMPVSPSMAMAVSGGKGSLLSRIKRLIGQPAPGPTFSEGFVAALVVVVGCLVFSVSAMAALNPWSDPVKKTEKAEQILSPETEVISKPETTDETEKAASVYTLQDTVGQQQNIVIIKNKKGKITELYVNGKRIPDKDIDQYSELVAQQLQATKKAPKATRAEVQAEMRAAREAAASGNRRSETRNYTYRYSTDGDVPPAPPVPASPPAPAREMLPPVPPAPPRPPMPVGTADKDRRKADLKQYEADMKQYQADMKDYEARLRALRANGSLTEERYQAQLQQHQQMLKRQETLHQERAKRHEEMAVRHAEREKEHQARTQRMEDVKSELIKDGILEKNAANLSIQLTDSDLIVNGKKQPQELHEKYKKMMSEGKGANTSINIQYNKN